MKTAIDEMAVRIGWPGNYRSCAVLEGRPGSFRVRPIGHYLDRGLVGRTAVLAEAAGVWRAGAAGGRVDRYAFRWHLSILGGRRPHPGAPTRTSGALSSPGQGRGDGRVGIEHMLGAGQLEYAPHNGLAATFSCLPAWAAWRSAASSAATRNCR